MIFEIFLTAQGSFTAYFIERPLERTEIAYAKKLLSEASQIIYTQGNSKKKTKRNDICLLQLPTYLPNFASSFHISYFTVRKS